MDLSTAHWRKATRSSDNGDHCVEIASAPGTIALRDSKDPHGPRLLLGREGFRYFAEAIKHD